MADWYFINGVIRGQNPLPPSAALPLCKGENVMSPLQRGTAAKRQGVPRITRNPKFPFSYSTGVLFFARTTAPTMATSSKMDAISNGSKYVVYRAVPTCSELPAMATADGTAGGNMNDSLPRLRP